MNASASCAGGVGQPRSGARAHPVGIAVAPDPGRQDRLPPASAVPRAVPLGTRSLRIARSTLDDRAGVIGAAVMVIEQVFAPDVVDRMVAAG